MRRILFLTASTLALNVQAADLPTGGQIVAGSGNISQSGTVMTVTQDTARMAANWDSFSIGYGHTVNFVQPDSDSIALNRVTGSDVSVIQGALTANGQVFLINPNGVLFTPTAQVSTGGIVATTLPLSNEKFLAGDYTFEGDSSNAVINQGNIRTTNGGTVALIAAQIINTGMIEAPGGNVLVGAGNSVTLDLGGPVKLQVNKGALNALIQQGGVVRADGGKIYMTAKAADHLASAVINHTGITEARTLATGDKGQILLIGDKEYGKLVAGGRIDASAPNGGDGGFVETSAAQVEMKDGLTVVASALFGKAGTWLIDPFDYNIDATAASNIVSTLNGGTNVTVSTTSSVAAQGGGAAGMGDINVNSAISATPTADVTLTLQAANTITVGAPISATGAHKLNLTLLADNDNGVHDGTGMTLLSQSINTNGGALNFGDGATMSLNGVTTKVGGDVYVGGNGSGAINLTTGGGAVNINGEVIIANTSGLSITTSGGNVLFGGIVNSGNTYTGVNSGAITWTNARTAARGATGGAAAVNDTYLATITSRLENSIAGRAVSYNPSWLGGQRVTGIGTNNLWRWVTGAEGAMDSGNGLPFFTQNGSNSANGIGGTAYNGGYSNWNTNEPNNFGGANLTASTETALQFVGTAGQWNDLPAAGTTLNYYVQEANLSASPLTVNAGAGTITFSGAVGANKALSSLNVTAGTIAVNGGRITTEGTQTYTGNTTLGSASTLLEMTNANTNFTLGSNRSISNASGGNASLTIKTTGAILMAQGSAISSSSNQLATTLWADSDVTNGGYIWMQGDGTTGASISSNGGAITLSGGANTSTGYATGTVGTHGNGITLDTATLSSNGGAIVLRGKSATTFTGFSGSEGTASNTDGIRLHGSNLINGGTGTVSLTGVAQGTNGSSNGIETSHNGYTRILSASTSSTAITLSGDASAGSSTDGWGTFLWGTNSSGIVLAATGAGGGISLNGVGRNTANGGGTHIEPSAFVLASSGPIAITGTKGAASTYEDVVINGTIGFVSSLPAGFGVASPVTSSSSNITITADSFGVNNVFGGGTFSSSAVQSSGIMTIAQRTNGKAINVQTTSPGAGPLWINPTSMFGSSGLFKTGFSKLVFGDSNTGNITLNNYTFDNDTELNTAGTATLGTVTIANHALVVNVTGGGVVTDSGTLTLSKLKLAATTSAVTLDSAANAIGTLAANVASLALTNAGALTIGTVSGMDGVTATGLIDIATRTGDLTVAKDITTTSNSSDALILNAGKDASAGTATGGNILISGSPSVTVGGGGRAKLYSGSVSGSTGLTTLVGAGRSRYYSDEVTTSFGGAFGTGLYAIFREQPIVTVTVDVNESKLFDGQPYAVVASVLYSGFVNGETTAVLSGTVSYGGTASGAILPGFYTITASGLSNTLGYTISYVSGTVMIGSNPIYDSGILNAQFTTVVPVEITPPPPPLVSTPSTGIAANSSNSMGDLQVVRLSSSDTKGDAQGFDYAKVDTGAVSGLLKLFVIDGGVHLPHGIEPASIN